MVCHSLPAYVFVYAMVITKGYILSIRFICRGRTDLRAVCHYDQGIGKIRNEPVVKINCHMNGALITGSLLGASSILFGAYGAHGLDVTFNEFPKMQTAYQNAVDYHMLHSILLVVVGIFSYIPRFFVPSYFWMVLSCSILAFSFSIYFWVLGGPGWLIKLTPVGGIGFVVSWLLLLRVAWINRLGKRM